MSAPTKRPRPKLDPIRRDSLYICCHILGADPSARSADRAIKALTRLTKRALKTP